jgi:predicted alpha/beta-hydrolase family hydrolase
VPYGAGIRTLVVQGATDAFGSADEVRAHCPDPSTVVEVKGGHGFSRPPADVIRAVLGLLDELAGA